jgi:hypothetical protein
VNANVAAFAFVAFRGLECDTFGSTTLAVLDLSTARFARMVLLAHTVVGHLIMTFDVRILAG